MDESTGVNYATSSASWRARIYGPAGRGDPPVGAGVLLHSRYVLTCRHVVRPPYRASDTTQVYVDFPGVPEGDRSLVPASVVQEGNVVLPSAREADLALLELETPVPVAPAALYQQMTRRGDKVHVTGYPGDNQGGEHADAIVMGRGGPHRWPMWVQLDPHSAQHPVRHGYSGSGVVDDGTDRVIGIVVYRSEGRTPEPHRHTYMISASTVLRHIRLRELEVEPGGRPAISPDVTALAEGEKRPAPGLRRLLAHWLKTEKGGEPVEVVFTGGEDGDTSGVVAATLVSSLPEHTKDGFDGGSGVLPRTGTLDLAEVAEGLTGEQLAERMAARTGRGLGGDGSPLLWQPQGGGPRFTAAFLSADRSASCDGMADLLVGLRRKQGTRLLLAVREPRSPLLERVCADLLDTDWHTRRYARIEARLDRLDRLGSGPGAALRKELAKLRPAPPDSGLLHALFRIEVRAEEALYHAMPYAVAPARDALTDLPEVRVADPDRLAAGPKDKPNRLALAPGQVLHEQYEVKGLLAHGAYGQVYLARDRLLENRPVALKGLHRPGSEDGAILRTERHRLVELNHPSLIRVINYAKGPGNSGEFLVMEFADGADLEWVGDCITRGAEHFADPARVREFVALYGLHILDALAHLHDLHLVYGDLSPTNVMHCGTGIKLIDLAGVRAPNAPGPCTLPPPETLPDEGAMTPAGDLYSVGKVLDDLLHRIPALPDDIGTRSLEAVLRRACAEQPEDRYADAREMRDQLRGVLREMRSLRLGEEVFEPSVLFEPGADLLDDHLGAAPPVREWEIHEGARGQPLRPAPVEPQRAAVGLPPPKTDPKDDNLTRLRHSMHDLPESLLRRSYGWTTEHSTPELHLLRCRLCLRLGRLPGARDALWRAIDVIGTVRDWRVDWHKGLLRLAAAGDGTRGNAVRDVRTAARHFDAVYGDIPGEYAPKLALGYCHEWLAGREEDPEERNRKREQAATFYGAVHSRNHAMGTAAFGLARIRLVQGFPEEAVKVLDQVPPDSRHRTASRVALLRLKADQGEEKTLREAWQLWATLARDEGLPDQDAERRQEADLLERLRHLTEGKDAKLKAFGEGLPARTGTPCTGHELHERLSGAYRALATQAARGGTAADTALAERFLDKSFRTRPRRRPRLWQWWRRPERHESTREAT